jgi:hypothetical protein
MPDNERYEAPVEKKPTLQDTEVERTDEPEVEGHLLGGVASPDRKSWDAESKRT